MRGLLWILAIALLGGGLLFLGWRLLPAEAREGAGPGALEGAGEQAPEPSPLAPLAPVESRSESARAAPVEVPQPVDEPASSIEPPDADGLEEGGLAQAARPLPDFGDKYAGTLRADRIFAAAELEREIQAGLEGLTRAEAEDLDARLARQPVAGAPTARVTTLLERIDELEWLRQRLALPPIQDP